MKARRAIWLYAVIILCSSTLAAQALEGGFFFIAERSYEIRGSLRPSALDGLLGIEPGRRFFSAAELDEYAARLRRLLLSRRVFLPSSTVTWEAAPELGAGAVRILVLAELGVSYLILPLPKYGDEDGFSASLRYRDYNVLGSLQSLGLAYEFFPAGLRSALGAELGLSPRFWGAEWQLAAQVDLVWAPQAVLSMPKLSASLSALYPFPGLGPGWELEPAASYEYAGRKARGRAQAGLGFLYTHDFSLILPYLNSVSLGPALGLYAEHELSQGGRGEAGLRLGAGLDLGRVDWQGNFRLGLSAGARTELLLPFAAMDERYGWSCSAEASAFWHWRGLLGLSVRAYGRWEASWTFLGRPSDEFDYAEGVRGLKDERYGDLGLFYNLDLPINLAQGRFLDTEALAAEVFFVPFIDGGYLRPAPGTAFFSREHRVLTTGLELIIFPDAARAFAYRLSAGYDLGAYLATGAFNGSQLELWMGLGLHF